MSRETLRRIEELFEALVDLSSAAREDYYREHALESSLRAELESLIACEDPPRGFLRSPARAAELDLTAQVRQALDGTVRELEQRLTGRPLEEAELRVTLGAIYRTLGDYPAAEKQLEQAVELRRSRLGDRHPLTSQSMVALGAIRGLRGSGEPEMLEGVLGALEDSRGDGTREAAEVWVHLAVHHRSQGRLEEACDALEHALELHRLSGSEDDLATLECENTLALLHRDRGSIGEAEERLRRLLANCRRLDPGVPGLTAMILNNLATVCMDQDRLEEAEALGRAALEERELALGDHHRGTLTSLNNLARIRLNRGDLEDAERLYRTGVDRVRTSLLSSSWLAGVLEGGLGVTLVKRARFDEAEGHLRTAHEITERIFGEDHPRTRRRIDDLITLYESWGKSTEERGWRARLAPTGN